MEIYTVWGENAVLVMLFYNFIISFAPGIVYFILLSKWEPSSIFIVCVQAGPSGERVFNIVRVQYYFKFLGLQMGYFLQKWKDYIIIEKASVAGIDYTLSIIRNTTIQRTPEGSFFLHYPRHRKIISINKRHTGKESRGCCVCLWL